ncbi:MAG: hypothetical protein HON65_03950 [Rhodospirillales bacterium]|nr:hypothetical protein [Rhodospirillales bacterium]
MQKFISLSCAVLGFLCVLTSNSGTIFAQDLNQTLIRALDLHVSSSCEDGAAIFKVRNVGANKISAVNFKLFKVSQDMIVSKRRMSLNQGQVATFKVKNASLIPDRIGLFVDSKLVVREQHADVAIQCTE